MADQPRVYYDHEPAYRIIKQRGGRGWDALFPGNDPAASYLEFDAFFAGEHPAAGATALDVGCGGGQLTIELARRGFRTTGVDVSATASELAQANAREAGVDVQLQVGNVLDLAGLSDDSFDLVIDNHLLHCIVAADDRARVLASLYRVLVPGGRLWSATMSAEGNFNPARFDADPATAIARNGRRIWVRRAQLEQELIAAGFMIASLMLVDDPIPEDGTDLVTIARKPEVPPRRW